MPSASSVKPRRPVLGCCPELNSTFGLKALAETAKEPAKFRRSQNTCGALSAPQVTRRFTWHHRLQYRPLPRPLIETSQRSVIAEQVNELAAWVRANFGNSGHFTGLGNCDDTAFT